MILIEFILKAKLSGYAGGGEGQRIVYDDGSFGYEYLADGFKYIDRYQGFNPFVGSEQIYDTDNALIWAMNYFGEALPNGSDPGRIYAFLKEAMLLISSEYPFRGPEKLEKHHLRYENQQHGCLDRFHGVERIYENNHNVYVLYYHGGKIKKAM